MLYLLLTLELLMFTITSVVNFDTILSSIDMRTAHALILEEMREAVEANELSKNAAISDPKYAETIRGCRLVRGRANSLITNRRLLDEGFSFLEELKESIYGYTFPLTASSCRKAILHSVSLKEGAVKKLTLEVLMELLSFFKDIVYEDDSSAQGRKMDQHTHLIFEPFYD